MSTDRRRLPDVRATANVWSGTIVLGSGIVVYVGPGADTGVHRHDAIQVVWSPDRPVLLGTERGPVRTRAALVPSRESHVIESDGGRMAIVLVEPTGRLGRRLDAAARRSPDLSGLQPAGSGLPATADATAVVDWARSLVAAIVGDPPSPGHRDVRPELRDAGRFIDAHLGQTPRLADTAGRVGLSPRQLRRSFAAEFGMPYRRYVLWRRLRCALLCVRDGADLTTAAATAGFADSAHLSRTFRDTFGLTPSEVLPLLTVAEADFADG
jgi:AraC-like DNA-binding protein